MGKEALLMKKALCRLWGFRSGTPWKKLLAVLYYGACAAFLVIGMTTPPLIECGMWDTVIVKLSTFVLFLWMLCPAICLSDTALRARLPLFKKKNAMYSLVGLMIAFVIFQYLFTATEGLHTHAYLDEFRTYIGASYEAFVEAGTAK